MTTDFGKFQKQKILGFSVSIRGFEIYTWIYRINGPSVDLFHMLSIYIGG